jgi:hypothetical protein
MGLFLGYLAKDSHGWRAHSSRETPKGLVMNTNRSASMTANLEIASFFPEGIGTS